MNKTVLVIIFTIGMVLFLDQLYLLPFGINFGGFLPDLSWLDPTQTYTEVFHHWMIGLVLMVFSLLALVGTRRR